jgi:hypothetical protein
MDGTARAALQIVSIFGPLAIAGGAYWYLRKQRRLTTHQWPVVTAKIVHSTAGKRRSRSNAKAIVGVVILNFEYVAGGEVYDGIEGIYEEEFATSQMARRQLANYLTPPFYIRYDSANPSDYSVDPYRDVRGPAS